MANLPARRAKIWSAIPGISLALTASGTSLGGSISFATADTVLRMMGQYIITPTSAPAALDNARVVVAIGVVSSDAFAAGSASVPDPAGEPEYPWLYWADHPLFFSTSTTDPNSGASTLRHSFDVRSMRKLKPRESLAMIVEYADIVGAPPLQFSTGQTRVLIALP